MQVKTKRFPGVLPLFFHLAERELRSLLSIARKISFGSQSKTGLKEAFGCSWGDRRLRKQSRQGTHRPLSEVNQGHAPCHSPNLTVTVSKL